MLTLKTERQVTLIVNNVVIACKNINKLNKTGYNYLYLCSGFIAHYNLGGFIDYYTRNNLIDDILDNIDMNQWTNFHQGERDYEYMMQKRDIYNKIIEALKKQSSIYIRKGETFIY